MIPPLTDNPGRRWWTWRRFRVFVFVSLLVGAGYELRRPLFAGNVAVVAGDRVYRSAQPGTSLEKLIRSHHLRAIVNLRGGKPTDLFYANETEVARRLGVEFYDIPLSATHKPSREQLLQILDLFQTTQYPLLIHCKWGADRTGLVSALYRLMADGLSPDEAMSEFSLAYGHVPLFGPERLHEPIQEYARWLGEHKIKHTPQQFRSWVEQIYRSTAADDASVQQGIRTNLSSK